MSTLRTNAILDASGGTTATVNGIPLRPGVLDPENRIINGAFDFWQRGTSTTATAYAADRWINVGVNGTVTQSRQSFTLGDTLGNNSPTFFLRQTVSGQSGTNSLALTAQRVESVRSYAGQTITVLGWARRSSGSGNMVVEGTQNFGTGGSPSADVTGISPTTVTLTSSWTPFAATLTVPSISGKTLGTSGSDQFAVVFWTSAGSDFNSRANSLGIQTIGVDLWGIHIKQGTHTTSAVYLYRQPELGPELARCQRYCVVMGGTSVYERFGICELENASSGSAAISLPVKMRGGLSVSSTTASGFAVYSGGTIFTASAIGSNNNSLDVANVTATISGGTVGRAGSLISNNNTTARLTFDAEL